MKRRKFTPAQRAVAVKRVSDGEAVSKVAADLKTRANVVYSWRRKIPDTSNGTANVRDAIVFLRHAEKSAFADVRSGKTKELSKAALYASLALRVLTGGV